VDRVSPGGSFVRALRTARCGVVVCPREVDGAFALWLAETCRTHPLTPVLGVARFSTEMARRLLNTGLADLIWLHEAPTELGRRLGAVAAASTWTLLEGFQALPSVYVLASAVVGRLCRRDKRALLRVKDVLRIVNVLASTLQRAFAFALRCTPKEAIDWVVLLRAVALVEEGCRPTAVPNVLGMHERTLRRLSRRLASTTLVENSTQEGRTRIHVSLCRVDFEAYASAWNAA
jgi:AraC-like DNA-binding protein